MPSKIFIKGDNTGNIYMMRPRASKKKGPVMRPQDFTKKVLDGYGDE